MPYYVVNTGRGRSTHVMKSKSPSIPGVGTFLISNIVGFGGGTVKYTLCGLAPPATAVAADGTAGYKDTRGSRDENGFSNHFSYRESLPEARNPDITIPACRTGYHTL